MQSRLVDSTDAAPIHRLVLRAGETRNWFPTECAILLSALKTAHNQFM
jgi:hypothetical protein